MNGWIVTLFYNAYLIYFDILVLPLQTIWSLVWPELLLLISWVTYIVSTCFELEFFSIDITVRIWSIHSFFLSVLFKYVPGYFPYLFLESLQLPSRCFFLSILTKLIEQNSFDSDCKSFFIIDKNRTIRITRAKLKTYSYLMDDFGLFRQNMFINDNRHFHIDSRLFLSLPT